MLGSSGAITPASPLAGMGARSAAADSASHAISLPGGQGCSPGRASALADRACSQVSAMLKDSSRGGAVSAALLDSAREGAQHSAAQHAAFTASVAAAYSGVEEPGRPAAPSRQDFIDDVDELGCDMTPEKQQQCHSARRASPVHAVELHSYCDWI